MFVVPPLFYVLRWFYALPAVLLALGGLGMEGADADPLGFAFTTLGNLGLSDELRADALAAAPASSAAALRELRRLHNDSTATQRCHLPSRKAACAARGRSCGEGGERA